MHCAYNFIFWLLMLGTRTAQITKILHYVRSEILTFECCKKTFKGWNLRRFVRIQYICLCTNVHMIRSESGLLKILSKMLSSQKCVTAFSTLNQNGRLKFYSCHFQCTQVNTAKWLMYNYCLHV